MVAGSTTSIVGVIAWATGIIAAQAVLWLAWVIIAIRCEPGMEVIVAESDALLPFVLQQFITLCWLTVRYWYLLVVVGAPLAAIEFVVLVATRASQRVWLGALRYATLIVFAMTPLLLLLFGVFSLVGTSMLIVRELAPAEVF